MRVATLTCFLAATLLQADTLHLRDGRVLQGTFLSGGSQSIRFLEDGGRTQTFALTSIDRLAFGDGATSGTSSRSRMNENRSNSSYEVPSGMQISVRTIDPINSNDTDAGRRYKASLDQDLVVDGRVVAPRGSDATIEVVKVDQGRAIGGREEIALVLSEISASGRRLTPVTQNAQISSSSRGSQNVKVIGGTAALGAIIGAIAGGGKGAAIGAGAGAAAGTGIQAVRGQKIEVPSETQLLFTLSQPMRL